MFRVLRTICGVCAKEYPESRSQMKLVLFCFNGGIASLGAYVTIVIRYLDEWLTLEQSNQHTFDV